MRRSQSFHAALNRALTNSGNTLLLLAFRACRAANAGTLLTPLLTYSERSLLYLSQSEASRWPGLLPGPSCCGCVSKTDAAPASDDITANPEMNQAALCAAMTKPLHSGPPHPRRATRHGVGPEPQYLSGASRRLAVRNDGRRNCRRQEPRYRRVCRKRDPLNAIGRNPNVGWWHSIPRSTAARAHGPSALRYY